MLNAQMQINDASVMQFRANRWLINWNCINLYRPDTRGTL